MERTTARVNARLPRKDSSRAVGHNGADATPGSTLYRAHVGDVIQLKQNVDRSVSDRGPKTAHEPLTADALEG
jgi:hypothetical protein